MKTNAGMRNKQVPFPDTAVPTPRWEARGRELGWGDVLGPSSPAGCMNHPGEQSLKIKPEGFPGGAVVKNPPANAGHMGSSPGPGRSHMSWSN